MGSVVCTLAALPTASYARFESKSSVPSLATYEMLSLGPLPATHHAAYSYHTAPLMHYRNRAISIMNTKINSPMAPMSLSKRADGTYMPMPSSAIDGRISTQIAM